MTLTFDLETGEHYCRWSRHPHSNFGISRMFRSRLMGKHLSGGWRNLATLTFAIGAYWRSWRLLVIQVFVHHLCTKFMFVGLRLWLDCAPSLFLNAINSLHFCTFCVTLIDYLSRIVTDKKDNCFRETARNGKSDKTLRKQKVGQCLAANNWNDETTFVPVLATVCRWRMWRMACARYYI